MLPPSTPPDEDIRLAALKLLNVLDSPPEERFDRITRVAARLFDVPISLVSLIDTGRQWFKSCYGLSARETPRDISFCGHAILEAGPLVVPDATLDPRFADNPLVVGEPQIRFYAGHPVRARGGHQIGTVCLIDRRPRQFGSGDAAALADLAAMVEAELAGAELRRLQDELSREVAVRVREGKRLHMEHAVSRVIVESLVTEDAVTGVLRAVCESLDWQFGASWAINRELNVLFCEATWHAPGSRCERLAEHSRKLGLTRGLGLPGRVWADRAAVWVSDVFQNASLLRGPVASSAGIRGACAVPVLLEGAFLGSLVFYSREPLEPDPDLLQALESVAGQTGQFIARKRTEEAVRRSEERFRSLIDATAAIVWSKPDSGEFETEQPGWSAFTGQTFDQLKGWGWLDAVHPDDRPHTTNAWSETVASQSPYHVEHRLRRRDGVYRHMLVRAIPITGIGGEIQEWVGAHTDIDAEKRAEAAMRESQVAAETANRAKSEFLANMSHEIRTPMTAILGYADILLEDAWERREADTLAAAQTVKQNAEHLLDIINDVLDLSKVEAGRFEVEVVPASPAGLVAEVVSLMRVRAEAKRLPLCVEFSGPVPETVLTDPTRLRQILINLIGNAVKFTEIGSVTLRVRLDRRAEVLEFCVVDTGIGMDEGQLARLFQPFSQVDTSAHRRHGGTGLGLAISKRLAELLGGTITVRSTPGSGSEFSLVVPTGPFDGVRLIEGQTEAITPPMPADTGSRDGLPVVLCGRVLLAEDGPDNQRLISFHLKKAGAEVTVAENGRVAVDVALEAERKGEPFDVVLMDMQMPVLDGYEATRELRRAGYRRPVIALTAHAMAGDREKCEEAGCDDYATKPIDKRLLLEVVATHLGKAGG